MKKNGKKIPDSGRPDPNNEKKTPKARSGAASGAGSDEIRRIVNRTTQTNRKANTPKKAQRATHHTEDGRKPTDALPRPKGLVQRMGVFLRNRQRKKARRRISPALRIAKRILAVVLVLAVVAGIGTFITWKVLLSYVNRPTEASTTPYTGPGTQPIQTTAEPPATPVPEVKGITNLLLLGVDNRVLANEDNDALSDVVIVVTIDADNKVVKLTSFQRDMLVYVPGRVAPVKLSQSHFYGGAEGTMNTLNANFRLDLKDYVEVNINEAERLIDAVGGVDIDVSPEILWYANECISMQNLFFPNTEPVDYIETPGLQTLNGRQAVGYARVRHLDSDYQRMGRQREVLQAVFEAFLDANLFAKTSMVTEGLSIITTTLSDTEITKLALQVAPAMNNEILQKQVPNPDKYKIEFLETIPDWHVRVDLNGIIPDLHQFIYNDEFPFSPVQEIPGAPNSSIPLPGGVYYRGDEPSPTPTPEVSPTPELSPTPEVTPTTAATTKATTAAPTPAATPTPSPTPVVTTATTAAPTPTATPTPSPSPVVTTATTAIPSPP